jgi:hypothetical protein
MASDFIPPELQKAQIEAAFREFDSPGSLIPVSGVQTKQSVTIGPISVTYATATQKTVSLIDGYMSSLLDTTKVSGTKFLLRA